MIRVKNRVFLALKTGVCHLQKKFFGVQPFIAENKKTESKSKYAPRKTDII
jgi:hypothetical protein